MTELPPSIDRVDEVCPELSFIHARYLQHHYFVPTLPCGTGAAAHSAAACSVHHLPLQVLTHQGTPLSPELPAQPFLHNRVQRGPASLSSAIHTMPSTVTNRYGACFHAAVGCALPRVTRTRKLSCIPWPPSKLIPD